MKKSVYRPTGIEWEYVNLRNISLLQISFWASGLDSPGFYPPLRFHFGNYIGYGVPGQGNHGIFDKRLMKRTLRTLQQDIDRNPEFARDLHRRASYIYRKVRRAASALKCDLKSLDDRELKRLYFRFREALVFSPIILMPMYAVDGCLDENYEIMRFLKNKKADLNTDVAVLSTMTYPTVAYSERESFLKLALVIDGKKRLRERMLAGEVDAASLKRRFPEVYRELQKHRERFDWVNSEYLSDTWTDDKYLEEMVGVLKKNPAEELQRMRTRAAAGRRTRRELIRRLRPLEKVSRAMDALNEFVWETDYSKGVFSEAFLSFRNLLGEVSRRCDVTVEDLYQYEINELDALMKKGTRVPDSEVAERKTNGYLMLLYRGKIRVFSGQGRDVIAQEEKIDRFFRTARLESDSFRGIVGSCGKVLGSVRLVKNISEMNAFRDGEILVTHMTTMEFTPLFHKARAVVTDEGGLGCHAAIVSREFGLPCIVGTKIATQVLHDGDLVEVDAERGMIKILKNNS